MRVGLFLTIFCSCCCAAWSVPSGYKVAAMFNNFLPSGALDTNGLQYKAAIVMALDQINNKSDGYLDDLLPNTTLQLLTVQPENSKTGGAVSSLFAIDAGVRSCIGPQQNSPIEGGGKLLMENGVLQIGYQATEDDLTNRVYNNFVRTNPPRAQEAYVAPMLTHEVFGWTRIAFVKAYTTFGFHSSFKYDIYFTDRLGIPENEHVRTDHVIYPIQQNYTSVIEEIRATKFNILYLYADVDHAAAFLAAAYKAELIHEGMQLIVASGITEPSAWKNHLQQRLTNSEIAKVLRGAIGFRPIVNRTRSGAIDFIDRFISLPHTLGNGTHCDQSVDDDGYYYNQNQDGSACAGLNFSTFESSGSGITSGAFYAYDAVITLAKGLHRYLHVEYLESLIPTPYHYYYLMQSLNHVAFDGASGHIAFEPFPDRQNNDRLTDNLYEVVNFNPVAFLQNDSFGFFCVGYVNTNSGFTYCDPHHDDCHSFVFNTKDGKPPLDRPEVEVLHMAPALKGVLIALAVITFIAVLSLGFVLWVCRNRRLVRVLQPEFAALVFCGSLLLVANAIITSLNVTTARCAAMLSMQQLGCCFVIAPLVAKTARINIVLNNRLKKIKVTVAQSFLAALGLLSPIFICTANILSQDSIEVGTEEITNSLETHNVELQCRGVFVPMVFFMYSYQAGLMLLGLILCYPIRKLPAGISDVSLVAKATVTIVCYTVILLVVLRVLSGIYPSTSRFLVAAVMILGSLRVMCYLYGSAAVEAVTGYDLNDKFQLVKAHDPWKFNFESLLKFSRTASVQPQSDKSSSGSGRQLRLHEHVPSRAQASDDEREYIVLEIRRLNQRLLDIVNKQLYHSQISQAVMPPSRSSAEHDSMEHEKSDVLPEEANVDDEFV